MVKSINKEVSGKVSEVSLSSKNTGGQYLVKINLGNVDKSILSGMFVNVQFPVENKITEEKPTEKVLVPTVLL
jgi:multidrug efflux pump subunit AcrA (membrane-fusion protein)